MLQSDVSIYNIGFTKARKNNNVNKNQQNQEINFVLKPNFSKHHNHNICKIAENDSKKFNAHLR